MKKQWWIRISKKIEPGDLVQCRVDHGQYLAGTIQCVSKMDPNPGSNSFFVLGSSQPTPTQLWRPVIEAQPGTLAIIWNNIRIKPFELGDIVSLETVNDAGVYFQRVGDRLSMLTQSPELYLEAYVPEEAEKVSASRPPADIVRVDVEGDEIRKEVADMLVTLLSQEQTVLLSHRANEQSMHLFTEATFSAYAGHDLLHNLHSVLKKATEK